MELVTHMWWRKLLRSNRAMKVKLKMGHICPAVQQRVKHGGSLRGVCIVLLDVCKIHQVCASCFWSINPATLQNLFPISAESHRHWCLDDSPTYLDLSQLWTGLSDCCSAKRWGEAPEFLIVIKCAWRTVHTHNVFTGQTLPARKPKVWWYYNYFFKA